jgi:hypothetical protein
MRTPWPYEAYTLGNRLLEARQIRDYSVKSQATEMVPQFLPIRRLELANASKSRDHLRSCQITFCRRRILGSGVITYGPAGLTVIMKLLINQRD